MTDTTLAPTQETVTIDPNSGILRSRLGWKDLGYTVPTKARPDRIEYVSVPGYKTVTCERHLFAFDKVYKTDFEKSKRRAEASVKALQSRIRNMNDFVSTCELTIRSGWTDDELMDLAMDTYMGNYLGKPRHFNWHNGQAINTIRHQLTNYESLWSKINRGKTGKQAYLILRARIDVLVAETYPRFFGAIDDLKQELETVLDGKPSILRPEEQNPYTYSGPTYPNRY